MAGPGGDRDVSNAVRPCGLAARTNRNGTRPRERAAAMTLDLTATTSSRVAWAFLEARRVAGSPAMGMVLTLVIVTDEDLCESALDAATHAAREHPPRVLALITLPGSSQTRLDASVSVGGTAGPGETAVLRLHGELAGHPESVVAPLLLSDAPVVVWWPGAAPAMPATDPVGVLGHRRITDAALEPDPIGALRARAARYAPGDTDLAWTRLTPWRSMLAAALDTPPPADVVAATVGAEIGNPSAELLVHWLACRLQVPVDRVDTAGPGLTEARLSLANRIGDIALSRPDGVLATLSVPGRPDRSVALKRRDTSELIAEELRRLDPDDVYAATLATLDRSV
ncbi:MAG TPA: glucose-6-phosphate dehydrogenase assembly protein OpcA [Actinomycetes bacterium]|nr:glucose-6-phosphate dehydrogenase assembly protein OpcA [Actinomycetes bacterium]